MTAATPDPFEGAKWGEPALGTPSGTITYSFAAQNLGNEPFHIDAGLDPSYQADIRTALADWSAVANVHFQEVPDSAASDIRFAWQHIDGPYGTVAETYWNYQNGQMLKDWIGFDDSESYGPSAAGHTLGDGIDFTAIAEHEIGHALGLGHNTAEPAIMNPVMSVNQLEAPDIAGIDAIYGGARIAGSAVPAAATAHLPAQAHADPLIALPPASDPGFAHALLSDIEELASARGLPLREMLHQELQQMDTAGFGSGGTADHGGAAPADAIQQGLHALLAAQPHHDDWLLG